MSSVDLSVVIPTCDRAPVVLDTIEQLLALRTPAAEIIVIDQSATLDESCASALETHHHRGSINWIRRRQRSIPAAMNHGLRVAQSTVVLFLDDDIRIASELVHAHASAHRREAVAMVAGQVIQPWQQPLTGAGSGYPHGKDNEPDAFQFNAARAQKVHRFMGGNVSMRRDAVISVGGFDENFAGAAYRFEADFAQRFCDHGFEILFEPKASVFHLKALHGGTRSFGDHLHTMAPWHSVGRYYYLLQFPCTPGLVARTLDEALRTVAAREHLRAPWRVIGSLCAEVSGLALALCLRIRGRRLPLRELP